MIAEAGSGHGEEGSREGLPVAEAGSGGDGSREILHIFDVKFGFIRGSGTCVGSRIPSGILIFWTVCPKSPTDPPSSDFF